MATLQTLPEATTILPAGANPGSGSFAVRAFLYAVFKHRRLVLGIFLVVFLASSIAAMLRESSWRATSRVLVKIGETVQIAPAETPSKSIGMPLSTEVINTEAELVKSREVMEEAIHRLDIKPEDGTDMDEFLEGLRPDPRVTSPGALGYVQLDGWPDAVRVAIEPSFDAPQSLFFSWQTNLAASEDWQSTFETLVGVIEEATTLYGVQFLPLAES